MTPFSAVARDVAAADLVAAVEAGVVDEAAARALVGFVETRAAVPSPTVDEEDVRFVTSFNDVFVTLGIALLVGAALGLGVRVAPLLAAPLVAVLAWGLAEIFTARRRMAFPSIVLVAIFVAACGLGAFALVADLAARVAPLIGGAAAFLAGFLHWRRFGVPISVAAMTAGAGATGLGLIAAVAPTVVGDHLVALLFVVGLAVFAFAMRWDASDRDRRTRRTDTAFWLHVLAAPLIVHPLAASLGGGRFVTTSQGAAPALLGLFALLAVVALVVDRRALLVSALIYFGGSVLALIQRAGWGNSMDGTLAVGLVGAVVLVLSIAWTPLRALVLRFTPAFVRAHVPAPASALRRAQGTSR